MDLESTVGVVVAKGKRSGKGFLTIQLPQGDEKEISVDNLADIADLDIDDEIEIVQSIRLKGERMPRTRRPAPTEAEVKETEGQILTQLRAGEMTKADLFNLFTKTDANFNSRRLDIGMANLLKAKKILKHGAGRATKYSLKK